MNETPAHEGLSTSPPPAASPKPGTLRHSLGSARGKQALGWPAWVALGVVLVGILGWQWMDLRGRVVATQGVLQGRVAEDLAQIDTLQQELRAQQELVQAALSRVALLEGRFAESQGQQAALEGLYQTLARNNDERVLVEVEQLLGLATQQLQLSGDVQAAAIALAEADARLGRSARPQFMSLRQAIGKDLARLRAHPVLDVHGVSLKLESVVQGVDLLPLAQEARPAMTEPSVRKRPPEDVVADEGGPWRRWAAELWQEFRALIHVQRMDKVDPVVLPPTQAFFLRENLKIRLLHARLALLSRDQSEFRGEIRQVQSWLDKHFDPRDAQVEAAQATLKPLLAAELVVDIPSLADSQAALKTLRLAAERSPR